MPYDYDYFISYAHADNKPEDGNPGFVDEFVNRLRDSEEHQRMFGRKTEVFFDKTEIHNMSDWDNVIRSKLASSRFLIVLLSPGYFKSEYCAREFDWWMQHEMHRRMLGEGTAPMLVVDVSQMYDYQSATIPDIPEEIQARFPNWLSQIRKIQSGPQFDMHDLDRAKISEALDSLRKEVKDRVQRQDDAENSPNNALYPRYNENFVGRRENLRSLRKSLSEKAAATYTALTGLGGFGKTELALTYGHAFAWDYQLGRIFVKCENKTSLIDILLSCGIAEMNGWELPKGSDEQQLAFLFNHLKAKRDEIIQHNAKEGNLNTLGAHILLILDNVNKLELIWQENLDILPDYFHVIITTRESPNEFPYIHSEPVDCLSEDESVELLSNLRSFGSDPAEITAARQIAQSLNGFTLVVELTGAYLARNPDITYQQQYNHLITRHSDIFQDMADKTRRLARHSAQTVAAALESTLSALSDNARKALEFASLMVPDAVGFGWLPELVGLDENEGRKILDELTGYSLLIPLENEPNIARIHRLVADTVKKEIPEDVQQEIIAKIREQCNELLHKGKTFWCSSDNSWNIVPTSEFCLALAEQWTVESSEEEIDQNLTWMLNKSGDMLGDLGKMNEARKVFQQNYEICKQRVKLFSSNLDVQLDLSISYLKLGDSEYSAGNSVEAKTLYEKALEIVQQLAEKNPDDVETLKELSFSYERIGDFERYAGNIAAARSQFEKALEIRTRMANQMPDDIDVQQNLCLSYERLGDLENLDGNVDASRKWYEKVLEIVQQLADKNPEDVDILRELSFSHERIGDLDRFAGHIDAARKRFENVAEIRQLLANKIPNDVRTLYELSVPYDRLGLLENIAGNIDAARDWYKKSLEIHKQMADRMPNDVRTQLGFSFPYLRLGDLECDNGNAAAARIWYKNALEVTQRLADKTPNDTEALRALSVSYERIGDLERISGNTSVARTCFEKEVEIFQKLVDKMPNNVVALRDLGISYNEIGDLENDVRNNAAAQTWYEKALDIFQQLSGKMPNDVFIPQNLSVSYNRLGELERAAGNIDAARTRLEKALEIRQRLADKMPENASSQRDLSEVCYNLGSLEIAANNPDAAKKWYNNAFTILEQIADKMPDDVESQKLLGKVCQRFGDFAKADDNIKSARDWYEKALNILQQLANNNPDNVQVQKDLADTQDQLAKIQIQP